MTVRGLRKQQEKMAKQQMWGREKRSMLNWALTTSDFFGWVEALREHAGYEKIEDLSRTFWAHFPSASCLGYELPDPDEE